MMTFDRSILPVEIIFIPDYIVNALKSRGVAMHDIDNAFKLELRDYIVRKTSNVPMGTSTLSNTSYQLLNQKLSKIDIEDLLIFNDMYTYRIPDLCNPGFVTVVNRGAFDGMTRMTSERINDALAGLYESNTNNDMSINIKNTFDSIPGSDCLYLVLHKGFSNCVVDNNVAAKCELFGLIVNEVVRNFGEARANRSLIFEGYVKLLRLKSMKL